MRKMRNSYVENTIMGPGVFSEGDDFLEKAWEASEPKKRISLARKALDQDLDCIDAYVLLSRGTETLAECVALLREAVRVGEKVWASNLKDPEMHWWGFVGTRPFMRALHELGLSCLKSGDRDEAQSIFERMLKLNRNDNQGVRAILCGLLLEGGKYHDVLAVLENYPEDMMLDSVWARLACAVLLGNGDEASKQVSIIKSRNQNFLPLLKKALKSGKPPKRSSDTPYIQIGSKDEAQSVLEFAQEFLKDAKVKKALQSFFA